MTYATVSDFAGLHFYEECEEETMRVFRILGRRTRRAPWQTDSLVYGDRSDASGKLDGWNRASADRDGAFAGWQFKIVSREEWKEGNR